MSEPGWLDCSFITHWYLSLVENHECRLSVANHDFRLHASILPPCQVLETILVFCESQSQRLTSGQASGLLRLLPDAFSHCSVGFHKVRGGEGLRGIATKCSRQWLTSFDAVRSEAIAWFQPLSSHC